MIPYGAWVHVRPAHELVDDGQYCCLDVLRSGEPVSALILSYHGRVHAYYNRCVHMGRKLDCEDADVFDEDGELLRCSMHGVVYQPESGACLSAICAGKSLERIKVIESDGGIHIADKQLQPLPPCPRDG